MFFQNESFEAGAISCIDLCGLGKLTPNMVLMGFKVRLAYTILSPLLGVT